jgi:hypothetical protein
MVVKGKSLSPDGRTHRIRSHGGEIYEQESCLSKDYYEIVAAVQKMNIIDCVVERDRVNGSF